MVETRAEFKVVANGRIASVYRPLATAIKAARMLGGDAHVRLLTVDERDAQEPIRLWPTDWAQPEGAY